MTERGKETVSVPALLRMKREGEKIGMLTAYDYHTCLLYTSDAADE